MVRRISRLVLGLNLGCLLLGMGISLSHASAENSRIVSLKPNITEIIFALGAGDQLVGVTTYCKRPSAAKKLPRVADYIRANPEKILALKPDLVLGSQENSSQKEIQFLKNHGVKIELLSFDTLSNLRNSTLQLGQFLEREEQATQLVTQLDQGLKKLKAVSHFPIKPKTLLVVGYDPLVVVGGHNFIEEAFSLLGLENVAQASRLKYPNFSTEQVIQAAPELILDLSMAVPADSPEFQKNFQERLKWWQRFPSIPAVQQKRIIPVDIEEIRAVPSLPEALERVKKRLR